MTTITTVVDWGRAMSESDLAPVHNYLAPKIIGNIASVDFTQSGNTYTREWFQLTGANDFVTFVNTIVPPPASAVVNQA